jgi:hypothetical protein
MNAASAISMTRLASLSRSAQREAGRRGIAVAARAMSAVGMHKRLKLADKWIFGSFVGANFTDNSRALFQHVRSTHAHDIPAAWTIRADSPHAQLASTHGEVLPYGTVRAQIAAHAAKVLVISHGIHDIPGFASSRADRALRVRLGHGLTALKKTKPPLGRTLADLARLYDLVPVASEFELENKREWGIPREKLVVTGVPRFDELLQYTARHPLQKRRRLLYMPTWREWEPASARAIASSNTTLQIARFLNHPVLKRALEEHDAEIVVNIHALMRQHLPVVSGMVDTARIRFVGPDEELQALMASSDALITDYSSVTWDMLYIGRPVLFFAFDVALYEAHRGAYFKLPDELPGPHATEPDAMAELVAHALQRPLRIEAGSATERWCERIFAFRDGGNCGRVLAAIQDRLHNR